jgi:phage tail sheath protein FI
MVQTTYPGVYVQEIASGVRTIAGVGTSITVFMGRAKRGPMEMPVQCLSYEDFERNFSSQDAKSDLARAVKLFFFNGGTNCYVSRIAHGAEAAKVDLLNEAGAPTLRVTAKSKGLVGNDVRLRVDYDTLRPEQSFNLEVFRWEKSSSGNLQKKDAETYVGLSMDPASPRYAVDIVNQNSTLVDLADQLVVPSAIGFSQGGRPIAAGAGANGTPATFRAECAALFGIAPGAAGNNFRISVDGNPFVDVSLASLNVAGLTANPGIYAALGNLIKGAIQAADPAVTVTVTFGPAVPNGPQGQAAAPNVRTRYMRVESANGDVLIEPAASNDLARVLMLGTDLGGIEVSRFAVKRPAPNGVVFNLGANLVNVRDFSQRTQDVIDALRIATVGGAAKSVMLTTAAGASLQTTTSATIVGPKMFQDKNSTQPAGPPDPASDGVREKWAVMASAIVAARAADPDFPWTAEMWGSRLAIVPAAGSDELTAVVTTELAGANVPGIFPVLQNVQHYNLGQAVAGPFLAPVGPPATNGTAPQLSDYDAAYKVVDKEVDLFNLMVLPKDHEHSDATTRTLWGPASVFCQKRRAFLLIDPPADWKDQQLAVGPAAGVNTLRLGLVKDYSAVFYPRLKINEDGKSVFVGPTGAIAGLMARIDGTRGVWKAPAGTEADLRGITGLEYKFTDPENGVMNPKAVNTIRIFPNGIVNWGARTMDGDDSFASEYKYIPIRRLALFIEESLYRGLKWVVFEPNDEPLWAQIRLNVGAFMHDLFRQSAFQGETPRDAYFVKCDANTTTQNDRNLGVVNIMVGFAPLKPAEFVVLYLQQMAGQIQV